MRQAGIYALALVTLVGCAEARQQNEEEKSQLESAFETPADHEREHRQKRLDFAEKSLEEGAPYAMIDEDYFREESVFDYTQRIKAHFGAAHVYALKKAGAFVFETSGGSKQERMFFIYEAVTALKGIGGKVFGDKTIVWLAPIGQCTTEPLVGDDEVKCQAHDENGVRLYDEPIPE
jgi:hypothetical protein